MIRNLAALSAINNVSKNFVTFKVHVANEQTLWLYGAPVIGREGSGTNRNFQKTEVPNKRTCGAL
jgi:hypothetical protein